MAARSGGEQLLDRAVAACGERARPGGSEDEVFGRIPAVVARPGSAAQAGRLLAETAAGPGSARPPAVVFRGSGSKLGWGRPPERVDLLVETGGLAGVREHAAGDLVAIVGAGTTLTELNREVGAAGQRLSLDPPEPRATAGGVVAAGAAGPLRHRFGTARDLVVGVTVVLADGTVARSGGRVVKNVAGYDLGKLFTGSFGTLGMIAELVVRLHPQPPSTAVVTVPVAGAGAVQACARAVTGSFAVPSAVECDLGPDGSGSIAVLLEGVPEAVRAQAAELSRLLPGARVAEELPGWWGQRPWREGTLGVSVAVPPGRVGAAVRVLQGGAGAGGGAGGGVVVRGSAGAGVLGAAVWLPEAEAEEQAEEQAGCAAGWLARCRAGLAELDGTAVVRSVPAALAGRLDVWGPVRGLELMRRVKAQFDPAGRLAPGAFVGGM